MRRKNKNQLIDSLEKSLFVNFSDISVDFSEDLIDDVINDGLIKKYPLLKPQVQL